MATAPPITKETGSAVPLTPATTPRMEKIPAPIIPPTPILTAAANPKPLGAGIEAPAARRRTLLILPHSLDLDGLYGVHSLLRTYPAANNGMLGSSAHTSRSLCPTTKRLPLLTNYLEEVFSETASDFLYEGVIRCLLLRC